MAQEVVDHLEAVQVEAGQGHPPDRGCKVPFHPFQEGLAVKEAGQRVVGG